MNTFNFSKALELIKQGKRVARKGWNGKDMYVFLVDGSEFTVNRKPLNKFFRPGTKVKYNPHIDMKTADGSIVPWLASQTDILADDWIDYDEKLLNDMFERAMRFSRIFVGYDFALAPKMNIKPAIA